MLLFIWIWFYASVIWHLTRFPPLIASTKGDTGLLFYPELTVLCLHSSISLSPRCACFYPVQNWFCLGSELVFLPGTPRYNNRRHATKNLNINFSGGRRLWMKISLVSFISPIELSFGSATPARKPSAWCRWWWVFSQYAIFVRKVSPQPNYILGCSPPRHSLLLLTQMFFRTYVVCACHRSHITQTQCYSRSHSV